MVILGTFSFHLSQIMETEFTITSEYSQIPFDEENNIHASANIIVPTQKSNLINPLALVAVIDVSSSMHGERITLAKKTLEFIVDKLKPTDYFSIVTFGFSSKTIFKLSNMDSKHKSLAKTNINSIFASGCTNLSSGVFTAIDNLKKVASFDNYNTSLLLLTDGHANEGIVNIDSLVHEIEKKYLQTKIRKITTHCLGFGVDHDAKFLRTLSDSMSGMYYFIERTEQIKSAFAECLGSLLSIISNDVKLIITPKSPNVQINNILTDYDQERNRLTNEIRVNLEYLANGERRNIPLHLKFKKLKKEENNPSTQLTLTLKFKTLFEEITKTAELVISRPNKENCKMEKTNDANHISEQFNRVLVAETFNEAIKLGERNEFQKAQNLLHNLALNLEKSSSFQSSFTKSLINDINTCFDVLKDKDAFNNIGSKFLYSLSRSHYQQRSCGISSSAACEYLTDGQKDMLKHLQPQNTQKNQNQSQNNKISQPIKDKGRLTRSIRRLISDLEEIKKHPLSSVTAEPIESDLFEWHCNMEGPFGNPYHGIIFHIIMQFPQSYPFNPPKLFFCSYLKHDHVFRSWICLDMLQEFEWSSDTEKETPYSGWTTAYSVHSILLQLQSFLFDKADTSVKEIEKAKKHAIKFTCDTCNHSGISDDKIWPKLNRELKNENPYSSLSIPLAKVKKVEPKQKISTFEIQTQPKQENQQIKEENWVVVERKPNTKKKAKRYKKSKSSYNNQFKSNQIEEDFDEFVDEYENTDVLQTPDDNDSNYIDSSQLTATQRKNLKRRNRKKQIRKENEIKQQKIQQEQKKKAEQALLIQKNKQNTIQFNEKTKNEQKTNQISPFTYLSDELIIEILKYLNAYDLIQVSKVSRMFYQLSNEESLWIKQCYLNNNNFEISTENNSIHPKILFGREILSIRNQIFCFHTRKSFHDDIIGIPITYKRKYRTNEIQFIETTFDLLSNEAFEEDLVRKSVWKRPFTNWMPLYFNFDHHERSWNLFKKSIAILCDSFQFRSWMILDVLPKLMCTMVVSVMSGEIHASIVAIEGYCAFHHLLLKMIHKFPELSDRVDALISNFIKNEKFRHKESTASLGDFLPLVAVSKKYSWFDIRSAFIQESFDRNALWIIKEYPYLRHVDANYADKNFVNNQRLNDSFKATKTSKNLIMFHVYFLTKIARPDGRSLDDIVSNYDLHFGRPTIQMKEDLQQHCKKVLNVSTWPQYFSMISMKIPSPKYLTFVLNQSIVNSSRKGYHYSNFHNKNI